MKRFGHWFFKLTVLYLSLGIGLTQNLAHEVRFRISQGHMVIVKGSIGPLDDLNFLIDTGANWTFLSPWIAKKLRLNTTKSRAAAWGKQVKSRTAILPQIQIGPAKFYAIPVSVMDFSSLGIAGAHLDGIIGMNVLRRTNFTLDYEAKTMSLGDSPALESSCGFSDTELLMIAVIKLNGRPLRMLLDTGAKETVLYQRRLDEKKIRLPGIRLAAKSLRHLASAESVQRVRLPDVRLGSAQWPNLTAYLMKGKVERYRDIDGTLGIASLDPSRVHFDFKENTFSWSARP